MLACQEIFIGRRFGITDDAARGTITYPRLSFADFDALRKIRALLSAFGVGAHVSRDSNLQFFAVDRYSAGDKSGQNLAAKFTFGRLCANCES